MAKHYWMGALFFVANAISQAAPLEQSSAGIEGFRQSHCDQCHDDTGITTIDVWPNLAGQHEGYLYLRLTELRTDSGEKEHRAIADLTLEELRQLAEYYTRLPCKGT